MRKRLRLAVIGLVVVLVASIGALVWHGLWHQRRQDLAQTGLEFLPNVAQRIQDFHRMKMRDGRKIWEVAAREARYSEDENLVLVREPMVRLYLKDGRPVGLRGDEGRVFLDGRELRRIDVRGEIEVQFADYTVRTDRAVYRRATDQIVSPHRVEITGGALELSGDRMEVDVEAQRLRLFDNVEMTLRQQPAHERPPRP